MWPFKKRFPGKSEIEAHGPWVVAQSTHDGKPLFIRANQGLRPVVGHPDYAHQVGFAVRLRGQGPDGLPDDAEMAELAQIEETLCAELRGENESLLALVLTAPGVREFVFYTCDPAAVKRRAEVLARAIQSHRFQTVIRRDPQWVNYRRFA